MWDPTLCHNCLCSSFQFDALHFSVAQGSIRNFNLPRNFDLETSIGKRTSSYVELLSLDLFSYYALILTSSFTTVVFFFSYSKRVEERFAGCSGSGTFALLKVGSMEVDGEAGDGVIQQLLACPSPLSMQVPLSFEGVMSFSH